MTIKYKNVFSLLSSGVWDFRYLASVYDEEDIQKHNLKCKTKI